MISTMNSDQTNQQQTEPTAESAKQGTCCLMLMLWVAVAVIRLLFALNSLGFRLTTFIVTIGSGVGFAYTHNGWLLAACILFGLLFLASFFVSVQEEEKREADEPVDEVMPAFPSPVFTVIDGFYPLRIHLASPRHFATASGNILHLPAGGVTVGIRYTVTMENSEEASNVIAHLQVPDGEGNVWQAETRLRPQDLVEVWETEEEVPAQTFESMPEEWREAFRTRCLLTDALELLDDRCYHTFCVDGNELVVFFKYQYPHISLAVLEQESFDPQFLVLASHFVDQETAENFPPLVFASPASTLIFCNTLDPNDPWDWERDRPIVFDSTGERGNPQAGVTIVDA